jgi:hypothetical protein
MPMDLPVRRSKSVLLIYWKFLAGVAIGLAIGIWGSL